MKKKLNILLIAQNFWPENFPINSIIKNLSNKINFTIITAKLLSTQHTRILCTCKDPLNVAGEVSLRTDPLAKKDAALLFRQLALEALPASLRGKELTPLMDHPVIEALEGLPGAIWNSAPLLRHGKSMGDLEEELKHPAADDEPTPTGQSDLPSPPPPSPLGPRSTANDGATRWPPAISRQSSAEGRPATGASATATTCTRGRCGAHASLHRAPSRRATATSPGGRRGATTRALLARRPSPRAAAAMP